MKDLSSSILIALISILYGGREALVEGDAFTRQYEPYFRWDVKFGFRMNSKKKKISHQFFVDFQNVTDRRNVFVERYNQVSDRIDVVNQNGLATINWTIR